ncbi:hypothetical protein KXD93_09420 [Mucilaginibacter sp. BJC16-A38]|uniref:hypothetical protein n=1 Tax=Mucilaginibacter phenanthrenivorans TaxID=1234842 RepID=UPI0021583DC0|nr:hypothetical protein [Mucilaginibacter phenanthrenivorans]MCR8557860.1 hypothetical protein [Mucilaginibacter phenanthrenivorans]
MKTPLLFPARLKYLGVLLAIPGFILGYFVLYQNYEIPGFGLKLRTQGTFFLPAIENFTNELALTLVIIGLLLIAFSRVKREDELTAKMRLNALYWAILVNYILYAFIIVITLFGSWLKNPALSRIIDNLTKNFDFYSYNLFAPLLIFTGRFYFLLLRNKNEFDIKPVHFLPNKPYRFLGKWISVIIIAATIALFAFKGDDSGYYMLSILPLSLLLWVYSREKEEDEFIASTRLEAMQIAVYVNYAILLLSNFFVFGVDFLGVQLVNLVTIPLIFLIWFNFKVYRISRQAEIKSI